MKTTAADLAAYCADLPPETVIADFPDGGGEDMCDLVAASADYLANRARKRLEAATVRWRESIAEDTEARLAAWKALCAMREEFEAEQEAAR